MPRASRLSGRSAVGTLTSPSVARRKGVGDFIKPGTVEQTSIVPRESGDHIRAVLNREIQFVFSSEFASEEFQAQFLASPGQNPVIEELEVDADREFEDFAPHHVRLTRRPLLTPAEEVDLFRRMNYLKFRANALRSQLKPGRNGERILTEIEQLLSAANEVRESIILANVRLVLSLVRKYAPRRQSADEFYSEGYLALIRAVEKFDYSRGFRFSTYATHAIQRDLYRLIKKQQQESAVREPLISIQAIPADQSDDDEIDVPVMRYQRLRGFMELELDARDRQILILRFGLDNQTEPQTLQAVGALLGLSKERIRQLEGRAITKLQTLMNAQPGVRCLR